MFVNRLWGSQHVCQSNVGQSTRLSINCGAINMPIYVGAINMFVNLQLGNRHVCLSSVGY